MGSTTRLSGGDYLTQQMRALADAVSAVGPGGDGAQCFRLAEHLAAEGGVHRDDIMTATAALLAMTTWCEGDVVAARRFAVQARAYGRDSRELVANLLRLETGTDQNWLAGQVA
jgi:hypothetical protein